MQEGRVIPLPLDIEFKDISGPLTQFQAKKAERDGVSGVVNAINELSQVKVSEMLLPKQFDALWPTLEKQINEIPKTQLPAKQQRPQHEVLEELVASIRGLDVRVRETVEEPPSLRRRRGRFHPAMALELRHFSGEITRGKNDPLSLLILLNLVKDDLPWLYELGFDAYQQTTRGAPNAKHVRQRVFSALKMLRHGPSLETLENKETYMVIRELERFAVEFSDMEDSEVKGARPEANPARLRPPKSETDGGS